MSFAVRLSSDVATVDAGATFPLDVEVQNLSDVDQSFELQLEGLDPAWTALPEASAVVPASQTRVLKVFLKPPRVSESLAGSYPFSVRVRSLESGESFSGQALLEIRPFHHLSVDVEPRRGSISAAKRDAPFTVTVMNLGNSTHTVQLFANEPEDKVAFEFESDRVEVGPGQQKAVVVHASPVSRRLISTPRLHGISVTVRSVNEPAVMSSAQMQLEQRPLFSPGAVALFAFFVLLIVGWLAMMPKPPTIDLFEAVPREVVEGTPIELQWQARNAERVEILVNNEPLRTSLNTNGSYVFSPEEPGRYTLRIVAISRDRESAPKTLDVLVQEREAAPLPAGKLEIPDVVELGQPFLVEYSVNAATTKAILQPLNRELDIRLDTVELTASRVGQIRYTLVLENADGQRVEVYDSVQVIDPPKSKVISFTANPPTVLETDGRVRISWQLTGALRAELSDGSSTVEVDPARGNRDLTVVKDTTFTLTAYDVDGKLTSETITVKVQPATPPESPETPSDPSDLPTETTP